MKKMFIFMALGTASLLSAESMNSDTQGMMQNEVKTEAKSNVKDEDIAKKVYEVISGGWFSKGYKDVAYIINDGEVTLKGSVETTEDRKKIEDSVKKIDGVKKINNEIVVRSEKIAYNYYQTANNAPSSTMTKTNKNTVTSNVNDAATTDADKQLNKKIRHKLGDAWIAKGYETIVLTSNNGVVTITGFVEKFDDIKKVGDDVKKVDGVKSVNNQLNIKKK